MLKVICGASAATTRGHPHELVANTHRLQRMKPYLLLWAASALTMFHALLNSFAVMRLRNDVDADVPAFNVFTRRDGSVRHFWSGDMGGRSADPGRNILKWADNNIALTQLENTQ